MERGLALLGLGLALLLLAPSRRLASAAPVEDGMLALPPLSALPLSRPIDSFALLCSLQLLISSDFGRLLVRYLAGEIRSHQ